MKKILAGLFLALLISSGVTAHAANTVRVTLPQFSVTLGGQTVSNDYSRYPLLLYRDITYFPMTYYDCRLLGFRTDWSVEQGLSIERNDENPTEYVREVTTTRNARTQRAEIAEGTISVNGKAIDNSQEQYPLLVFRDVTYFPLTWRFAVEEFGWEYAYDESTGLSISNPAAALQTDAVYEGTYTDGMMIMGTGNLSIVCAFNPASFGIDLNGVAKWSSSMGLYNKTGENIFIQNDGAHWEYQIYRVLNGRNELVYRKAVPFYSGEIPVGSWIPMEIESSYFADGAYAKGEYHFVLVHPDQYAYQIVGGDGQTLHTPVDDGSGYAVTFSQNMTIDK